MTSRSSVRRRVASVTLGVGLALVAFGFVAPGASAVVANPTFVDAANPKCADAEVGSFPSEFKIDEQPPDGDSTWTTADADLVGDVPDSLVIEITNLVQGGDTVTFDWSATVEDGDDAGTERDPFLIDRVLVKASTGANMWTYEPPASSGTGLYSPEDSISHLSFCFGPHEPGGDDGPVDDGTTDDTTTDGSDDGSPDDGTVDDGTVDDGTVDDGTVDDGTVDDGGTVGATDTGTVGATDSAQSPAPTVAGVTVAAAALPATGANDYSLMIIGAGLALVGGISLVLGNRVASAAAPRYPAKHRR
jgi:LPXTG-motif cell wall-anchored protein